MLGSEYSPWVLLGFLVVLYRVAVVVIGIGIGIGIVIGIVFCDFECCGSVAGKCCTSADGWVSRHLCSGTYSCMLANSSTVLLVRFEIVHYRLNRP